MITGDEERLLLESIDYFILLLKMLGINAPLQKNTREKLMLFSNGVCTNLGSSKILRVLHEKGEIPEPIISLEQIMLPIYDLNDRYLVELSFEEVARKYAILSEPN